MYKKLLYKDINTLFQELYTQYSQKIAESERNLKVHFRFLILSDQYPFLKTVRRNTCVSSRDQRGTEACLYCAPTSLSNCPAYQGRLNDPPKRLQCSIISNRSRTDSSGSQTIESRSFTSVCKLNRTFGIRKTYIPLTDKFFFDKHDIFNKKINQMP